jgi:hypothetical protein
MSDRPAPAITAAYAASVVLIGVASFLPVRSTWGLNHLGYLFLPAASLLWFLVATSGFPAIRRRLHPFALRVERIFDAQQLTRVRRAMLACGFVLLFMALRSATPLWGDSELMGTLADRAGAGPLAEAIKSAVQTVPRSMGVATINVIAVRMGEAVGAEPRSIVEFLQALYGGVFVFAVLGRVQQMKLPGASRAWLATLIIASGSIVLFFGYLEVYALPYLLATVFALESHRYLDGDVSVRPLVLLVVLAALSHVVGAFLLPTFLFVLVARRNPSRPVLAGAAVAIVLVTLGGMLALHADPFASERFRPFISRESYRPVLSVWFVSNAFNLILLLVPAAIVGLVVRVVSQKGSDGDTRFRHTMLAAVSLAPFALLLILFQPDLGMTRDWDIYAVAAPFIALVLIPWGREPGETFRAWIVPVLLLSVLQTGAWITVLASPGASEARYVETLERDPSHAGYAYEILAEYADHRGMERKALDLFLKALDAGGNPRYAFSAGVLAAKLGEIDKAIALMQRCLRSDPENYKARANLASYLVSRRDFEEVIRVTQSGLQYTPDDPLMNVFLAMALVETKRYDEAYPQLKRCETLALDPDMRSDVNRALSFVKSRINQ